MTGHDRVSRRAMLTVAAWLLILLVGPSAMRPEAQQPKSLAHLIKNQQNALKRLQVFIGKLDRLAGRLEREGQGYASNLLRRAHAHLLEAKLKEEMEKARRHLEGEQIGEAWRVQEKTLQHLQQCLSILLDRQNRDKIEAELEALQKSLKDLEAIREDQKRLHQETKSAGDSGRASDLQSLKDRLDDLAARQEALRNRTGGRSAEEQAAWNRVRLGLKDLEQQQARLAEALREAAGRDPARNQALRAGAEKALKAYARALQSAADTAASNRKTPDQEARAAAREAAGKTLKALSRAKGRVERAEQALDRARAEESKGDRARTAGASEAADKAFEEAARAAAEAADRVKRAPREPGASEACSRLAGRQIGLLETLNKMKEDLKRALFPEATREEADSAGKAMNRAAKSLAEAAAAGTKAAGKDRARDAADAAGRARRALDRASKAMETAERARAAGSRTARERVAGDQERLAEEAGTLAGDMEKAGKKPGNSANMDAAAQATREARAQMDRASQDIRQDRSTRARDRQREAERRLDEALERLDEAGPTSTNPKKVREHLARWQDKIRQKVNKLSDRLEALGSKEGRQADGSRSRSLKRAERRMKQSRQELDRGRMKRAQERQQEALADLNQAEREIRKRERDYIEMAQEEVIFNLGQRLRDVLELQEDINQKSGVEGARLEAGRRRMPRSVKRAFINLASRQRRAREDVNKIIEELVKEKIEVFLFLLGRVAEDMDRLGTNLGQRPPDLGRMTSLMQADVVKNLKTLLATLEEEAERRRKEREGGKKEGGGKDDRQGQPRLIPPTAELIMLKNYEIQVRERTQKLHESLTLAATQDRVPDAIQSLLIRLAHQQGQGRGILGKFMKSLNIR